MKLAVTGAFGYSGKYIAQGLLEKGHEVITLTNSPCHDSALRDTIRAFPLNFGDTARLAETLKGTDVLVNTYWVRFNHKGFTHAEAVRNTKVLFKAAAIGGVQRIVHVSIANPTRNSPLEYFACKAEMEDALTESGLSYAILRPTVLFGKEDILINNIAWAIRRLPVIGVFGNGLYGIQPVYVGDLASLAVEQSVKTSNSVINAAGPETFTYRDLVKTIGTLIGKMRPVVPVPPALGYLTGKLLGFLMNDVMLTRDEITGLMSGLLCVSTPPTGTTRLTDWIRENASSIGRTYASELARRRKS